MPFLSTLSPDGLFTASAADGAGEFVRRVELGYVTESRATIAVVLAFASLPGFGANGYEIVFDVTSTRRGVAERYFDGKQTKSFLTSKDDRRAALEVALALIRQLVRQVQPSFLAMTTFEAHLPDKALVKYGLVGGVLRDEGYRGGLSDSRHGRHAWMFERYGRA